MKNELMNQQIKEMSEMINKSYIEDIVNKKWAYGPGYEENYRIRDRYPSSWEKDAELEQFIKQYKDSISTPTVNTPPQRAEPDMREDMEEDDDVSPILAEMINDQ
jgi:hypothetical protein